MSLIPAYLGERDDHHLVCSQCPNSEETQKIVRSMEEKRLLGHLFHGFQDYFKKQVVLTLCDKCITKIEHDE
jgi:hypothetical protein